MNNAVSSQEAQIIDCIMQAICVAPHSERQRLFARAFGMAGEHGYTGWALMCRGFELLLDERYEFFNESLWERLEDYSYHGEARGQHLGYLSLRSLLFGYAHRRRADQYMDHYEGNLYGRGQLRVQIDSEITRASVCYERVCNSPHARIAAVAWHGVGKLALLQIRYDNLFMHNSQEEFRFFDRVEAPKRAFLKSVSLAAKAGFKYAPPMNAIAWLCSMELRDQTRAGRNAERIKCLEECLRWAKRAIRASGAMYAPPMLLKAMALHQQHLESEEPPDRKETRKLISSAIHLSPYDSMVQGDLNAFSQALKDDVDTGRIDPQFYLAVRFADPAKATKASVNRYLSGESGPRIAGSSNQLLVLRRWSSYTPVVALKEHSTVGGGYLLEWNGTRIAIDPGVGFLRNLHQYGYRVCDLDAVLVTHQHVDHVGDFEGILSILKTHASQGVFAKGQEMPTFLLTKSGCERWDNMIASALGLKTSAERAERIKPLEPSKRTPVSLVGKGIEITPVPVHNHQDAIDEASEPDNARGPRPSDGRPATGCGLVIRLHDSGSAPSVIGITSDTGYLSDETSGETKETFVSEDFRNCDIVVLHLSTVDDLDDQRPSTKKERTRLAEKYLTYECPWANRFGYSNRLYRKHLGFWGSVFLIRDLIRDTPRRQRTIVLSEFGEEMLKNRVTILNEMCRLIASLGSHEKEQAKRIYIGDIGTQIRLSSGEIGCNFGLNRCPNSSDRFLEFDLSSGDLSMPHRGWNDRELAHFCRGHDYLIGNPRALNPGVWGYSGRPVIDDGLREARLRTTGEVHKCEGNYWLL